MNSREFVRRAQRWAEAHGAPLDLDPSRGMGGHQVLRMGARWTTVQMGELEPGTFHAMLKQLSIPKEEF